MKWAYKLQRSFFLSPDTPGRNKAGYFILLWTSFDIILHSLPGNPNYFAISLKLRLTSLTGTFTREKILSRLTYFYIFLVFWTARRGELPRIIEEKFVIFNPYRCCNDIYSFLLLVCIVKINRSFLWIKTQRPRKIIV